MKTKKIVGLLLAGSMLISSLPVFAAVKVDKSGTTPEYELGETVTITSDEREAIRVYNSDKELLVWGITEEDNGEFVYELVLPDKEESEKVNNGLWVGGETYTVYAGNDSSKDSCKFKIANSGGTTEDTDGKITIRFLRSSMSPKKYMDVVEFDMSKEYAATDEASIDVKVTKNGAVQKLGSAYTLKYNNNPISDEDDMPIETTVKQIRNTKLYMWFKSTGTYNVDVTVTDKDGKSFSFDNTIKVKTSTGGGSSSGGSTNMGGTTWIPGITGANTPSGIDVRLNPSQETQSGVKKNVAYTAAFITPDTFTVGVTVDGVKVTNFDGYDPVYVKVPYKTNLADTSTLVVKDANGNIIPRSYYADGYMYVNLKDLSSTYTIFNNPKSFADVHHDWAVKQINALAAREIINGVGDNLFDPDRSVTRAEFTKMIITMFGVFDSLAVSTFADIDNSQWYAPYVATAQKLAVTNGYAEDNTFRPNQVISREEMSAMLYRAAEVLSVDIKAKVSKTDFSDDASIQDYAKVPVYKMQQAEVLKGVGNNLFDPQGTCTRAQAAVAIYNMFVLSMTK